MNRKSTKEIYKYINDPVILMRNMYLVLVHCSVLRAPKPSELPKWKEQWENFLLEYLVFYNQFQKQL